MFRTSDLEAYLDEALPPDEMARIEKAARKDRTLIEQLASINARRGAGVHSLGEIWRSRRLSCPTREQLENYLAGKLDKDHASYIEFHVAVVGCRFCRANMADLQSKRPDADPEVHRRRRKFFQSSAGYLG
ncbi:MAG: hypothetical protein JW959_01070 [Pirellulales bacterium]|nr:hypothetical protein [Pirellulales bacterium]